MMCPEHSAQWSSSSLCDAEMVHAGSNPSESLFVIEDCSAVFAVSSLNFLVGITDEKFPFEDCFLLVFFFVSIVGISPYGIEMIELEFRGFGSAAKREVENDFKFRDAASYDRKATLRKLNSRRGEENSLGNSRKFEVEQILCTKPARESQMISLKVGKLEE